jgi:hypothetical protein
MNISISVIFLVVLACLSPALSRDRYCTPADLGPDAEYYWANRGAAEGQEAEIDPADASLDVTGLELRVRGCRLRTYTQGEALLCLRDRPVLFIGELVG